MTKTIIKSPRRERAEAYGKLREQVCWYYHNTNLSLQKIANRFEISYGKAAGILTRKYPKYYQEYIENERKSNYS